jgi:histidine ammonia-lyase
MAYKKGESLITTCPKGISDLQSDSTDYAMKRDSCYDINWARAKVQNNLKYKREIYGIDTMFMVFLM